MTNPYMQAGRVASGDRFIGRTALVRQVAESWQAAGRPSNLRIVGLHRIGKSSLIRRALDEFPPRSDIITASLSVGSQDSGMDLFRSIVRQTVDQAGDNELVSIGTAIQTAEAWYDLVEGVRAFFTAVHARGRNVLVVLDEFDRAATAFTRLGEFQLLRDLASEPWYSLGLITVSRRNIEKIEIDAAGGSILGGVVSNARYVGMFSDAEADIMLARAAAAGIGLASIREQIISRTGPHPYLLELLCRRILEIHDATGKIDVAAAFAEESPVIEAYFGTLLEAVNADMNGQGAALLRRIAAGRGGGQDVMGLTQLRLVGIMSGDELFAPEFARFVTGSALDQG
jgi:hypothetical protein